MTSETDPPRIKRIRDALQWPQHAIGDWLGLSQARVAQLECGASESRRVAKLIDMLERRIAEKGLDATAAEYPFTKAAE